MTSIPKTTTGAGGEKAAARFLEEKGYKVVERNFEVAGSEVDLIALKGDTLVFVEVKTRGTDDFGLPEEFVDRRKRNRIIRAARIYRATEEYINCFIRFDIIAVLYQQGDIIITHIEHAFEHNG